jgi:hypothetical protein
MGFAFQGESASLGAHLCWGSWRRRSRLADLRNVAVRELTSIFEFRGTGYLECIHVLRRYLDERVRKT